MWTQEFTVVGAFALILLGSSGQQLLYELIGYSPSIPALVICFIGGLALLLGDALYIGAMRALRRK